MLFRSGSLQPGALSGADVTAAATDSSLLLLRLSSSSTAFRFLPARLLPELKSKSQTAAWRGRQTSRKETGMNVVWREMTSFPHIRVRL